MRLLRSFAVRTALGVAGAVLFVSLLGAGWGWLRAEQALRQQLDLVLAAEAEGLIRDYQTLGAQALLDAARVSERRGGLLLVLVQTADGQVLAGRLPGAPTALRGFTTINVADGDGADGDSTRALGALLPGGVNLIVAARVSAVRDAARALAWTPLLAALGAGVAALLLGFGAARALERRLASVSDVARLVIGGNLTQRLPVSGRGDEFDRLIATVNTMLARLEALVIAQRQVTDDIAHDLRGPLQRLRVRLEDAERQGMTTASMSAAINELDGVLGTFTALLRIASAESGARVRSPVDLSALVTAVAEFYRTVAEEAGRPFTTEIAAGVEISGDAALLQGMLANLLDNALTHGAGAIEVTLMPGPVLSVADQGPGVPEADRDAVLRRFVRLDRSRSTPGTGLGLALVAAAVHAHGGTIALLPSRADGGGLLVRIDLSVRS